MRVCAGIVLGLLLWVAGAGMAMADQMLAQTVRGPLRLSYQGDERRLMLAGRVIHADDTGSVQAPAAVEFAEPPTGPKRLLVLSLATGGNGCLANYLVVDLGHARPFVSEEFAQCGERPRFVQRDGALRIEFRGRGTVEAWRYQGGSLVRQPSTPAPVPSTPAAHPGDADPDRARAFFQRLARHSLGQHPGTAFGHRTVRSELERRLGRDYAPLVEALGVASLVERRGPMTTGQGCVPHSCGDDEGFFAIDPSGEFVYGIMSGDDFRFGATAGVVAAPAFATLLGNWNDAAPRAFREAVANGRVRPLSGPAPAARAQPR